MKKVVVKYLRHQNHQQYFLKYLKIRVKAQKAQQ